MILLILDERFIDINSEVYGIRTSGSMEEIIEWNVFDYSFFDLF